MNGMHSYGSLTQKTIERSGKSLELAIAHERIIPCSVCQVHRHHLPQRGIDIVPSSELQLLTSITLLPMICCFKKTIMIFVFMSLFPSHTSAALVGIKWLPRSLPNI